MQVKTYLGKLNVTIGEYENKVSLLVVANSDVSASKVLKEAAQSYYGEGDEPEEDGGFYANGGEVHVKPALLAEIGLATFLELKPHLVVHRAHNVAIPDASAFDAPLQDLAQHLTGALNRKGKVVSHSQVLNAVASTYGANNWRVLKNKLDALTSAPAPLVKEDAPLPLLALSEKHRFSAEIALIAKHLGAIHFDSEAEGWCLEAKASPDADVAVEEGGPVYFSSLGGLIEACLETLIPDGDTAISTCVAHGVQFYSELSKVQGFSEIWYWDGSANRGGFSSKGNAARQALVQLGLLNKASIRGDLEALRRQAADVLFEDAELGFVEAVNGWEISGERWERVYFVDEGEDASVRKTFAITFKDNSAVIDSYRTE